MQLAANLSWLYRNLDWKERFQAASRDGFRGVEILQPYDYPPAWYAHYLEDAELSLVLINTPVGQHQGRLGWAAIPGAHKQFQHAFERSLAVAQATGCQRIHIMAGYTQDLSADACLSTLRHNLDYALAVAERENLTLTLEALNRSDMPGYFYHLPDQVIDILRLYNSPRLRLQFDYYHCMKEELDILSSVNACSPWIGHVQIAGAESRQEPDLKQPGLLEAISALPALGYDSWLGCEYEPRTTAADNLSWCQPLRDLEILE